LRFSPRNSQRPAEIAKEFEQVDEWLYHRGDDPRKAGISKDNIVKYRSVLESVSNARGWLNAKARGEKLVKVGGIQVGSTQWDKKKFALNIIAASKRHDRFDVPKVIYQAAMQNDSPFFRRLGGLRRNRCGQKLTGLALIFSHALSWTFGLAILFTRYHRFVYFPIKHSQNFAVSPLA